MISILLPSKNEPNAPLIMAQLEAMYQDVQIIVCNDTDGRGKGFAIRTAMTVADGELICFLDADGDIHPKMLQRLLPFIQDYDIVVGTKGLSGHWTRKVLTVLSRLYIRVLFGIPVSTQTGIKLFRRGAVQEFESNGFLFDLEILAKAKKRGFRMIEVPVEATISKTMKASSVWKTLKESVALWKALR